jgi:tetratricopeptide (TPR) repeat protein
MILPLNLIALYPYPLSITLLSFRYLLPILLVIGITVAAAVIAKKQSVWLAIWSYYLVSLLPVLGIFQVGSQSMADRYTYLPSLGPFFAAGLLAAWIFSQFEQAQQRTTLKRISFAAAATVILCLSSLTVKQIGIWKNSITLWDRVIEKEPNKSYIAYANRGKAFEKIGQSDRAIEDFTAAISLNPMNHVAFYERAISYEHKGLSGKAIEDYNRVISLTPDNVIAYLNRGMLFEKNALMNKALEDYDMAISLDPMNYEALNTRGVYYINNGFIEKAFADFSSAISINSGYEDAYNNRGVALEKLGQLDEAIADYTAAITLNPLDYSAFNNRGLVYHRQGASDKALEDFCRAIAINQNYGLAYNNRGYVYLKMGKPGLAGADFEKACASGNQGGCKALKEMSKRFPLPSRYS